MIASKLAGPSLLRSSAHYVSVRCIMEMMLKLLKLTLLSVFITSCGAFPYYESEVPLERSVFELVENLETIDIEIERTTKLGYATWKIPVPTKEFLDFFKGIPRNKQQSGNWYGMSSTGQFNVSGRHYELKVIHVKSAPSPSVLVVTEPESKRTDSYVIHNEQKAIEFRKWLLNYLVVASKQSNPYKVEAF